MNFSESIISALSSLLSNKMRSILTMLGIIIGISSVILITSVGNGFNKSVSGEFEKLGFNGLEIYTNTFTPELMVTERDKIKIDDKDLLLKHEAVDAVSLITSASGIVKLKNPNESKGIDISATDNHFTNIRALELSSGRFLNQSDYDRANKVIVIDEITSKLIFGRSNTVGEKFSIEINSKSTNFTIVGVIKNDESEGMLIENQAISYIPITTLYEILGNEDSFLVLLAKANEDYDVNILSEEIKKILGFAHNTNPEKYVVSDITAMMGSLTDILTAITAFISFVAAISLVVGGVGVMNIMLVTVTERTREIGIRKSLGATNGNIQFQFLIESIFLTAIGGAIGIIIGYSGSILVGNAFKITPVLSIPIILAVVIISSLIGIVFGVYPANKAAKLDPIEALRYE